MNKPTFTDKKDIMEEEKSRGIFDIRYVKLKFEIVMTEDTKLPVNKVSALRGGMGEILLEQNCVRDRNCEACDFESECIVRRTMYSKYEIQPEFATGKDSIGYVLECENYGTIFEAGSRLIFYLILFGKTIVYLNQYLLAFYSLGRRGLGKNKSVFYIDKVLNEWNEPVVDGANVYMSNYRITTILDYINFRMNKIDSDKITIKVKSQTSLKYRGEMLNEFNSEAVMESAARKIYMLDCYEGIDKEQIKFSDEEYPLLVWQSSERVSVKRYSSTADSKMTFSGIKGEMKLDRVSEICLKLLLAAELTHIGKNTSFGFGRIKLSQM